MKQRSSWRRGAVLLQALVMAVLLSMMSVMIIKWVFARYIIANRLQQGARNAGISAGYAMTNSAKWTVPSNANTTINGKAVSFAINSGGSFTAASGGRVWQFNTVVQEPL